MKHALGLARSSSWCGEIAAERAGSGQVDLVIKEVGSAMPAWRVGLDPAEAERLAAELALAAEAARGSD